MIMDWKKQKILPSWETMTALKIMDEVCKLNGLHLIVEEIQGRDRVTFHPPLLAEAGIIKRMRGILGSRWTIDRDGDFYYVTKSRLSTGALSNVVKKLAAVE